jgi:hypothetical protein
VQVEGKLKQHTATAAADTAVLQGALEEAFVAAEDLHQQLAAAEEREAALSKEVLAVRGQVRPTRGLALAHCLLPVVTCRCVILAATSVHVMWLYISRHHHTSMAAIFD